MFANKQRQNRTYLETGEGEKKSFREKCQYDGGIQQARKDNTPAEEGSDKGTEIQHQTVLQIQFSDEDEDPAQSPGHVLLQL